MSFCGAPSRDVFNNPNAFAAVVNLQQKRASGPGMCRRARKDMAKRTKTA
jgi:hypothetical protein